MKRKPINREISKEYLETSRMKKLIILGVFILTLLVGAYSLNKGAAKTSPGEILNALLGRGDDIPNIVLWNIRLPRILGGLIAGAGLGIAGLVMQTCLGNPLASPSTLGISNAAVFGANIAIVFFNGGVMRNSTEAVVINNPYLVTGFAFGFALLAMLMILSIARFKSFSKESIILAGVAFSSLFSAGSTLIQYFAEDFQIAAMVFWTFGDLGRISWREVTILAIVFLIVFIYYIFKRWDLNGIDSGEDTAISLGINVDRIRLVSMFLSSLITAIIVSFVGVIGFVGLIAPQIMRRILGVDHRFLVPASAIGGSLILLSADTIARTIISPIILPVGAITSFFGAPLFLFLLMKGDTKR